MRRSVLVVPLAFKLERGIRAIGQPRVDMPVD
jgi:hypothetical protein